MSEKDPVVLVEQIQASVDAAAVENQKTMAHLKDAVEKTGNDAVEALQKADASAEKLSKISASIIDMEQKLGADVMAGKAAPETLGQSVIKSDAFKQFAAGDLTKMRVQANTITGQEGSPPVNSDTLVPEDRMNGIVPGAFRALRVRDVLPSGVTSSNAVTYARELLFTNNAAETAEGAQKPESVLTFESVTTPIATIAHTIKVSKQVLDDAPMLASYIDARMRYGVELRYDEQIIKGNGTGQNISGILTSGNHTAFSATTGENALDSLNRMIEKVALADYAATAIMMNPADWHAIERLKVGSADDRYIVGNPAGIMGPQLWGLPVVLSNNVTAGKAIVGAFDIAYMVFNRQGTTVEIFNQNEDDVEKNLLTVRAENRGALASLRPASVQAGDLTV